MQKKIELLLSMLKERIPGQEVKFFKDFLKIYFKPSDNPTLENYAKAFITWEGKEATEQEIIEGVNSLLKDAEHYFSFK